MYYILYLYISSILYLFITFCHKTRFLLYVHIFSSIHPIDIERLNMMTLISRQKKANI